MQVSSVMAEAHLAKLCLTRREGSFLFGDGVIKTDKHWGITANLASITVSLN
jgi:hypothetical protein